MPLSSHQGNANLEKALLLVSQGHNLWKTGDVAGAAESYQQAIRFCPGNIAGYLALLTLLVAVGDTVNAERVVEATPKPLHAQSPVFRFQRARLLVLQERYAEALPLLDSLQGTAGVEPGWLSFNLGVAHDNLGHLGDACRHYARAHDAGMRDACLFNNWARASQLLGDAPTTERLYRNATRLYPDDHGLRYEQALFLLKSGNYPLGFKLYRHRWQTGLPTFAVNAQQQTGLPAWDGRDASARVLVTLEQGIGEQIVFSALLPALARKTANVGVAPDPRLAALLGRTWPELAIESPVNGLLPAGRGYDAALSFADLGQLALEGMGWQGGYLVPDPERVAALREKYRGMFPGKRLVGISWMSRNSPYSAAKSMDLRDWSSLLADQDSCFINLQYGTPSSSPRTCFRRCG